MSGDGFYAGNLGVGTNSPTTQLHVVGQVRITGGNPGQDLVLTSDATGLASWVDPNTLVTTQDIDWVEAGGNVYNTTNNVGIGTANPDKKLHVIGETHIDGTLHIGDAYYPPGNGFPTSTILQVNGPAVFEEVWVQTRSTWPDFVFEENYNLRSIAELQNFIEENGHLPDVPSTNEVERRGSIELGQMNSLMLQKIEELTLYVIAIDHENKELKRLLSAQVTE